EVDRHLADVARREAASGHRIEVGKDLVPDLATVEGAVADEGDDRDGDVEVRAGAHDDVGGDRGAEVGDDAGDDDDVGHAPHPQLLAPTEHPGALPQREAELQRSENYDLKKR